MKNIAIFASGTGSNAKKIIEYLAEKDHIQVALIISNKATAPVLDLARANNIPTLVIDRKTFYESETILDILGQHRIDFIVLAGFLWLIPAYLVRAFTRRMVNIHPALLPSYGGKGMYGIYVHRAVKAAGDTKSGITIHFVNENYDEGDIIFQASCPIDSTDSPETIAKKVLKLEHHYFARVIEKLILEEPMEFQ